MTTPARIRPLRVALAGNPNAGKSSVFNALTGGKQHVGNWPGKTVARKEGRFVRDECVVELVDLPGTYSLTALSVEEEIARDYLVEERPDVVVAVADATNIERNLFLVVQLLELGAPLVLALNMSDVAAARRIEIDAARLETALGCRVVATAANRGTGMEELVAAVLATGAAGWSPGLMIDYGREIATAAERLEASIATVPILQARFPARWLALNLLEGDARLQRSITALPGSEVALEAAAVEAAAIVASGGVGPEVVIADHRYGWINGLVHEAVRNSAGSRSVTDLVDRVLANRILGLPLFLGAMWAVFKLTTDVASIYLDWIEIVLTGPISRWAVSLLGIAGLGGGWVESLVVDGVIAGVGGVLVFIPVLLTLYAALAVLEDSGYMARAAFIMDRVMHRLGLHGKSFLPMLVGFGCTVPAIYATRTLENEKDRILTGLLVPFMSCGARLPVYILFAAVFFPEHSGTLVFAMYLIGIATAMVLGVVLKRTVFRTKERSVFVMELPAYRLPSFRSIRRHTWERTAAFVKNAWTLILGASLVVWLLLSIPLHGGTFAATDVEDSAFAAATGAIAPVFAPLGFGTWEATGALATGFVAKEVVVATVSQVYGFGSADPDAGPGPAFVTDLELIGSSFAEATVGTLRAIPGVIGIDLNHGSDSAPVAPGLAARLQDGFAASSGGHAALAGLAFMVFVLIYTPCIAAIAASRHEFGRRWMWTSVLGQLGLAWVMALAIFQIGKGLGWG